MIKAVGSSGDGTPLVILGLSRENLERLPQDQPIKVDLTDLGLPPTMIFLIGGETEDSIKQQLIDHGLLDERTEVREDTDG